MTASPIRDAPQLSPLSYPAAMMTPSPRAPTPGAPYCREQGNIMERWKLTYANRDAMLGEVPAKYETGEFEADTGELDEKTDEQTILDKLHHIITEHTDGAGVLTGAEKL